MGSSSYAWEEVKRLAKDFQRTQLHSFAQKLSESNCIEIVQKLCKEKLLDVVFTTDGKSYVTPIHLSKEIRDHLCAFDGRVDLIELAKLLNVDPNVISSLASDLVKENSDLRIVLGRLIDESYVVRIAEEINERLKQCGYINVNDLARCFNLPVDFIQTLIKSYSGKIIQNTKQDKSDHAVYYTQLFIARNKAVVRGAILAITKPTSITAIKNQCGVDDKIYCSVIDSLMDSKQIPGIFTDGVNNSASMYIPQFYLKTQSEWVRNFYKQNGYLEYNSLVRVGINDAKSFINKTVEDEKMIFLSNCAVGPHIFAQVEAAIEDVIANKRWINILTVLPSVIEEEDASDLLGVALKETNGLKRGTEIFNGTCVVSSTFLNDIRDFFTNDILEGKVRQVISGGLYESCMMQIKSPKFGEEKRNQELSRKEERKKRANAGKAGGGAQGRETKTKAIKKKYNSKNKSDSEEEDGNARCLGFEFIHLEDIRTVLSEKIYSRDEEFDCSEFVKELAAFFYPLLNSLAEKMAKVAYQEVVNQNYDRKKKKVGELQDGILSAVQDAKYYMKGIKMFDGHIAAQLHKYLLKTTGNQIANLLYAFISDVGQELYTLEERQKIFNKLDSKPLKEAFGRLNRCLAGSCCEEFLSSVEDVLDYLNIMLKKVDKKKERIFLEAHKQALVKVLNEEEDCAVVLHLAALILFHCVTQTMLHASGRFVSNILDFLSKHLPDESNLLLRQYYDGVTKFMKLDKCDPERESTLNDLRKCTPGIKRLVLSFKSEK